MMGLAKFLVETILGEAAKINKVVVVYSGRFQPFHKGHYATYDHLVKKFGKDNVYIASSDVTDSKKSPFRFKEKKVIMQKMFGIPSNRIVQIKNPYAPSEVLSKFDSDSTAFISAVGEKDASRLSGKYFKPYTGKVDTGYIERGYTYIAPAQSNPISGTDVRYWLSAGSESDRKKGFMRAYPKFDEQIFQLITLKLKALKECINEEIKLNVKVGDEILMGKFKNKKVVVKSIGKDEWGMPTINGKKAVTFRIPKKEELKEAASNAGFSGTAEPDTSFMADGQPRILNKAKPENWYKQGGYTQLHTPKADSMRGKGKSKDTETQFRKAYYKLKNVVQSTLNPADDPHKVEDWDDAYRKNPEQKPKRFWELPKNQKDTIISKEDINEIVNEMESFILGEMAKQDLDAVEKYADNQLSPEDIELGKETDHFFQRLNDPRNGKPISAPELTGFFKRLARNKKKFIEFVKQYKEFVVNDTKTNINIAFMKAANKLIAKTVMRKADFKTTSPIFKTETIDEMGLGGGAGVGLSLPGGYINGAPDPKDAKKLKSKLDGDGSEGYEPIKESSVKDLEKQLVVLYNKAFKMMPKSPAQMKVRAEIDKLKKQIDSLKKESINESLLLEGGAYGHMNHPFDIQMNLTFGDLKNIVKKALSGDLELAREKTDGQALAISWVNGRLVAARNKSHTKNKGEGAMTIGQVAQQFAGRGELTNAYTYAMNDLSKAVTSLSEPQRKKIFKDGTCFMNLEVIYPKNSNVIPYGQNLLVFHGTFEYDKEGEVIGQNQEAAKILAGMIKQVNKHVQDTYTIQGPPIQKLPKSQELSKLQGKYIGLINKLQKEFALKDTDGVADYHQAWWTNFVEKGAKKLDAQEKIGLVKRWAFGDKSFRINQIQDAKIKEWADKTDKQDQAKIAKENIMKFEEIFLGVGADVLSFMESVLTANPDSATKQLRAELGNAIKQIKASGNPQQIEKLKIELSRLNSLGGFDKIVPNEGIVFVYGGNTYKLTGAFAPLNQILGIFKYGR
jgi:hypothetical protein